MGRTFILHANGAKLPTDLLGLTCVRYGDVTNADEINAVNQKLRKAIEDIGGLSRIEGLWWQFSITERNALETFRGEPAAHLTRSRSPTGGEWPLLAGRRHPLARDWSEAAKDL